MITRIDRKYLEIDSLNKINSSEKPKSGCKVEKKNPPDFQINKFFYKNIGKSYRWIDRLVWNDTKWMDYTNNSNLETYILSENDNLIGFFELLFHPETRKCEVAYFGIFRCSGTMRPVRRRGQRIQLFKEAGARQASLVPVVFQHGRGVRGHWPWPGTPVPKNQNRPFAVLVFS